MITLYTWKTPNGRKPAILLEELGLAYRVRPVDIGADEQFEPDFLALSPNNKIPAIVDHDALGGAQSVFESGAILTYLAAKEGRLLAPYGPAHVSALEWLYWSIGGLGPMLGQLAFFAFRAEQKAPPAIERFTEEGKRLLGVLEKRLADSPYIGGHRLLDRRHRVIPVAARSARADGRGARGDVRGVARDRRLAVSCR